MQRIDLYQVGRKRYKRGQLKTAFRWCAAERPYKLSDGGRVRTSGRARVFPPSASGL